MLGKLYIVATPIGNLEDITLRAVKVLSSVDLVLAEDTRVTKKLLDSVLARKEANSDTMPKLDSYHQHSGEGKKLEILNHLLNGKDIALVTDAGTPGISDPGNELVDYLLSYQPELQVIPIPGPSAISTALSVCGFDVAKFLFLGFWPKKKVFKLVQIIKTTKLNVVFYESPFRLIKTLNFLEKEFGGDSRVFIGRELTKIFETLYRGKLAVVRKKMLDKPIKGEIVVVLELRA